MLLYNFSFHLIYKWREMERKAKKKYLHGFLLFNFGGRREEKKKKGKLLYTHVYFLFPFK